jgi:hypothetical protein
LLNNDRWETLSRETGGNGESEHPDNLAIEFGHRPGCTRRSRDVELLEKVFDLSFSATNRTVAISWTPVAKGEGATNEASVECVPVARGIFGGDKLGDKAGAIR